MSRHPFGPPLGGFQLTDAGMEAIGRVPSRDVPLVVLRWRPDWRDLRDVRSCEDACTVSCVLEAEDPTWEGCR